MISSNIEAVLVVTGVLTAGMLVQFVAPSWILRHAFREVPSGAASIALARHWGLLLFCIGGLLIYAGFHPAVRKPAVLLASIEKAGFVACVLGTSLRHRPVVAMMAIADAVMLLVYGLYLSGL